MLGPPGDKPVYCAFVPYMLQGALKLSSALMSCTNLRNLHVAGNRVSVVGGGALLKGA